MGSLLDHVVGRSPLAHGGFSGAGLERVLMDGGGSLVLKRISRDDDWLMRASDDHGRVQTLWQEGIFRRVPEAVDHAVVAVERDGDGWLVFMRDVSTALFEEGMILSRPESRQVLAAAAELHEAFWDDEPSPGLCRLADRYASLSPATAAREDPSLVVPGMLRPGWEAFAEIVAGDVSDGILAILERPSLLAEQLEARPCTLVHGDLKLANLGLRGNRVVMLDWGSWTGFAPPAVELAWYVAVNWSRIDASREEIIEDFRERADLDWWVARAREGFETWYPA